MFNYVYLLWLYLALGCIEAAPPPIVDGFYVHKTYIGPYKEQYNESEHFYCTGGVRGQACLLQACARCRALDWCHSFGKWHALLHEYA